MTRTTLLLTIILSLSFTFPVMSQKSNSQRTFYQLTMYRYGNAAQEQVLDDYLQHALLPALHQLKIKQVGVFKAIANDTSAQKSMYVLIPVSNLNMVATIQQKLDQNKQYLAAADAYLNASYRNPPYNRKEIILLQAFPDAPQMVLPKLTGPKAERVYELRSYESPTTNLFKNKVHMFNQGDEIGLFKRLNFNAIFYGEVVAGSKMPNLMYMTSFENKADRDEHWNRFRDDAAWKKLSGMEYYKNNVSHIDISFLRPTAYSDY